jgi:hypothetical protein
MVLSVENFQRIKEFILKNGDRRTYCNMYNHNPHYEFGTFHVYLNPEGGQSNINCDPDRSDFDEIIIQDWDTESIYFGVKIDKSRLNLDYDEEQKEPLKQYFKIMLKCFDN